jgi:ketosteroid isomerase-like protein
MRKILNCLVITLMSFTIIAELHAADNADLHAAIKGFDHTYTTNDVEKYFNYYAEGATLYMGDDTRQDIAAYHEMWIGLMAAGGGVEVNDMSKNKVQVMPSGDFAISTSFVNNRTRSPDGTTHTSNADVWQKIDGKWKVISLHYSTIPAPE